MNLEQLRNTPDLTPEKFATLFTNFDFVFRADVQTPEAFLANRSGDCDDFSVMAAMVLKERGYTPRLVAVRMPKVVHVVCYIEESGAYLDYNRRGSSFLMPSGPGIHEIAQQVARSYGAGWSSASEFTWENGAKRLVKTVLGAKRQTGIFATVLN